MKRFELEDEREFRSAQNLVLDNVPGDLGRQDKRKAHRISERARLKQSRPRANRLKPLAAADQEPIGLGQAIATLPVRRCASY